VFNSLQQKAPSSVKKGNYKLALALVDKTGKRSNFRLAIDLPVINDSYIVSEVSVK
jgi:hypothetical protein